MRNAADSPGFLHLLRLSDGADWLHMYIAVALAAGLIVLLTGALMGLVFLSSGAGHDEAVRDWDEDQG